MIFTFVKITPLAPFWFWKIQSKSIFPEIRPSLLILLKPELFSTTCLLAILNEFLLIKGFLLPSFYRFIPSYIIWFMIHSSCFFALPMMQTLFHVTTMGVYFFWKILIFPKPVLCVVFKILKLPQNFSPKLGYFQKKWEKFAKNEEKLQKSKIVNKK